MAHTNISLTLNKEVKPAVRFKVYKSAIFEIRTKGKRFGMKESKQLCLLLPCLLWNLEHYLHDTPKGGDWSYRHAIIAFPEIKKFVLSINTGNDDFYDITPWERNLRRIEVLEQAIKTVTKLL